MIVLGLSVEKIYSISSEENSGLYRFVSGALQVIRLIHGRIALEIVDDFCFICSVCHTNSVERNEADDQGQ